MFIIIYNAGSDFDSCSTRADAEKAVAILLSDGYAHEDIEVYTAEELEFTISDIQVELKEK